MLEKQTGGKSLHTEQLRFIALRSIARSEDDPLRFRFAWSLQLAVSRGSLQRSVINNYGN
jgi:hypothetical protein